MESDWVITNIEVTSEDVAASCMEAPGAFLEISSVLAFYVAGEDDEEDDEVVDPLAEFARDVREIVGADAGDSLRWAETASFLRMVAAAIDKAGSDRVAGVKAKKGKGK